MVICYSSPRELIDPTVLFMTFWKRPNYWEENISVLPRIWDWGEINAYKGPKVKTAIVYQNSKTCNPEKDEFYYVQVIISINLVKRRVFPK